jgi:hypothetical protein
MYFVSNNNLNSKNKGVINNIFKNYNYITKSIDIFK